jgi:hypothetical protein
MGNRRGNPNWGKAILHPSAPSESEFEKQVRQLKLTERGCAGSNQLRLWCEQNKNRVYVPESLLKHWGISVNPYLD